MLLFEPGTTVRPVAPGTLGLVADGDGIVVVVEWLLGILAEGADVCAMATATGAAINVVAKNNDGKRMEFLPKDRRDFPATTEAATRPGRFGLFTYW